MLRSRHLALHRVLVSVDLALISLAFWAGSKLSIWLPALGIPQATELGPFVLQLSVGLLAWLLIAQRQGLYRSRRTQGLGRGLACVTETWFLALATAALLGLWLHGGPGFSPIGTFAVGLGGFFALRLSLRAALRSLRWHGLNYRRALFVGGGDTADHLLAEILGHPHYGIVVVGGVPLGEGSSDLPAGVCALGDVGRLPDVLTKHQIDYVLLCPPADALNADLQRVFEVCNTSGTTCHYAPEFLAARHLHPAVEWSGRFPAVAFESQRLQPLALATKRGLDIAIAGTGLLVLAPLMLLIAALIKLHDRGPVLFAQKRLGHCGRAFACLKFRTMCVGAERMRRDLGARNEQDGPAFKMRDDPRVTPVGRWLRRYSLDELPQLINVLLGDMSLVGPRPPIPEEVDRYDLWQRRRMAVPPGITCIWQVQGRASRVSFQEWMQMDLYYVDHWSLWMDVKLMVRTLGVVLRGTGT